MAKVKVNFSDDNEFEVMPAGDYPAVVFEIEMKDGNEYPYLNWTFKIDEDTEDFGNRRLWNITSFSPRAAFRMKNDLDALGVEYDSDEDGNAEWDTDDAIGLPCVLRVGIEQYQGKDKNVVKRVLPADTAIRKAAGRI